MGRRKPYAFGTQNEEEFKNNVKKNNNGTNGNGTGNKSTNNKKPNTTDTNTYNVPPRSGGSTFNRVGKDPFKGIKPGMTKAEIDAKLKENNQQP
tara:strand:+ start:4630 stop:4911 length:282 start_codon:yes stop_codon:yes gene_type:complete